MIMIFPLFLIVYALVGWACIKWIKRRGYSNRAVWAVGLLWFPGLLVFDVPFGWAAFHNLCSNEAGHVVFETVKTDGYAYIDRRDLVHDRNAGVNGACGMVGGFTARGLGLFMYIETEVTHPRSDCLADTPGKYRYTLLKRGNPKCTLFERLPEQRKKKLLFDQMKGWAPDQAGEPESWCIGVEQINAFQSRYIHFDDGEPLLLRLLGIQYMTYQRVIDTQQNRVIAQWFKPAWNGGWVSRTFFWVESYSDPVRSCKVDRYTQTRYPYLWYLGALQPQQFDKGVRDSVNESF